MKDDVERAIVKNDLDALNRHWSVPRPDRTADRGSAVDVGTPERMVGALRAIALSHPPQAACL
jgi:hypothetical protein